MRKIIFIILVSLPVLAAASDFASQLKGAEDLQSYQANESGGACFVYPQMTIVAASTADEVGQQLLVKNAAHHDCSWDLSQGWLVDSGEASYYLGKWNNYLFIERGTGPSDREIVLVDTSDQQIAYSELYALPLRIKHKHLNYWQVSDTQATSDNCPSFEKAEQTGLSAQIEVQVDVDLQATPLSAKPTGATRCSLVQ